MIQVFSPLEIKYNFPQRLHLLSCDNMQNDCNIELMSSNIMNVCIINILINNQIV